MSRQVRCDWCDGQVVDYEKRWELTEIHPTGTTVRVDFDTERCLWEWVQKRTSSTGKFRGRKANREVRTSTASEHPQSVVDELKGEIERRCQYTDPGGPEEQERESHGREHQDEVPQPRGGTPL